MSISVSVEFRNQEVDMTALHCSTAVPLLYCCSTAYTAAVVINDIQRGMLWNVTLQEGYEDGDV